MRSLIRQFAHKLRTEFETAQRERTGTNPTSGDQARKPFRPADHGHHPPGRGGDKSLSTNGHNVKIIISNGMVTLRGPVKSAEEGIVSPHFAVT